MQELVCQIHLRDKSGAADQQSNHQLQLHLATFSSLVQLAVQ